MSLHTITNVTCPYCGQQATQVSGKVIYPHRPDLYDRLFWLCEPCNAYVGCHYGTSRPLGRLANSELRLAKRQAHVAFDKIWQHKHLTRRKAYAWLARQMGLTLETCHIGMFDVNQCEQVVRMCAAYQFKEVR